MNHQVRTTIKTLYKKPVLLLLVPTVLTGCALNTYQAKIQNNYFIVIPGDTQNETTDNDPSKVTLVKIRKILADERNKKFE